MSDLSEARDLWPAGHRAALVVVIHIATAQDVALIRNDPGRLDGIDYQATGLQRLLTALADLDVTATTAWTASAIAASPQLVRLAADHDHEVALSVTGLHSTVTEEMRKTVGRLADQQVSGSVDLAEGEAGLRLNDGIDDAADDTYSWSITANGGDFPMLRDSSNSATLRVGIPTSPFWNDAAWLNPRHPAPPSSLLESWSLGLQSMRTIGGVMTIVLHPHISGRPGFTETITRFLDEAIAAGDVWIPKASDLADWWRQRQGDER